MPSTFFAIALPSPRPLRRTGAWTARLLAAALAADALTPDPDAFRAYAREHKQRGLASKLMTEEEAVATFVEDGDYLVYDCNYLQRGPASLIREIIRQRKKDLWIYRTELDVRGQTSDGGRWVVFNGEKYEQWRTGHE